MKIASLAMVGVLVSIAGSVHVVSAQDKDAEKAARENAAMASLDEYMAAFNARDPKAYAATLHYPHVRIASGQVKVWQNEAEYAAGMDFDAFSTRENWHHSAWDYRNVVQSSPEKIHIAVQFTRYNAENKPVSSYESMYIMTLKDGKWGTQARSSFAR